MKKMIVLVAMLIGVVSGKADSVGESRMAWTKAYLESKGLPVPDGGIKIIPENKMSSYANVKTRQIQYRKDIQKYGYIRSTHPATEQLFNIKITAAHDYKRYGHDFKPTSTHLKHHISDLKMAYTFLGVPHDVMDEHIGVAPYLTYLKDQGWVGAIQFFKNNKIGYCAFSENNVKLSHGSIIIAEEDVRQDIHGKITTVEVMGNPDAGFTYTVEWFDNIFFRKLECAHQQYSPKIMQDMIECAKKIEDSQ